MAGYSDGDDAANNGFGRRSLHQWEGRLLYMAGYPTPPDFRAPGGWHLSAGGVPIPPPPMGAALDSAIDGVLKTMSDEQRAEPRFFPGSYPAWNEFCRCRYEWELAAYNGPPPPPTHNNAAGRRRWWSALGRTLENMLAHIEGGKSPILGMPLPQVPSCRATTGARGCHSGWHPARPGRRRGRHPARPGRHRRRGW
jgi:hypothetical protein